MVQKEEQPIQSPPPKKRIIKRAVVVKPAKKAVVAVVRPRRTSIQQIPAPTIFVPPTPLPVPSVPVIQLPSVTPPKAPLHGWVYVLILFFSFATLAVVGYAFFDAKQTVSNTEVATESLPAAASESTSVSSSVSVLETVKSPSYLSVAQIPDQRIFFSDDQNFCHTEANQTAIVAEKPNTVPDVLRFNLVLAADIPEATDEVSFQAELDLMDELITLFSKHKLKTTIQLTSPFITLADKLDSPLVATWAKAGNEVAISFDPIAAFGVGQSDVPAVPFGSWLLALHKQQVELEDLCRCEVTSWTGGGEYPRLFQAAKELGLTTFSGWVSADGQTPSDFLTVNPWAPVSAGTLTEMKTFDAFGSVVYLPNGVYPETCPDAGYAVGPFDADAMSYLTPAFYASLASTSSDYINLHRLIVTPQAFDNLFDDVSELSAWNDWLTSTVDPYVKSGKVLSSTDSATGSAYVDWLDQNIGKIELK